MHHFHEVSLLVGRSLPLDSIWRSFAFICFRASVLLSHWNHLLIVLSKMLKNLLILLDRIRPVNIRVGQLVSNPLLHSIYCIFIAISIIILDHLCLGICAIIASILLTVIHSRSIHICDILIFISTRVYRLWIMIEQISLLCLFIIAIYLLILLIFGNISLIMLIDNSLLLAPLLEHFLN